VELRVGDLVEVVDPLSVLCAEPHPLRNVLSLAEDRHGVTLDGPVLAPPDAGAGGLALLRKWDQTPSAPGPLPLDSVWIELEHGVQPVHRRGRLPPGRLLVDARAPGRGRWSGPRGRRGRWRRHRTGGAPVRPARGGAGG
jgi:hypothetical protein